MALFGFCLGIADLPAGTSTTALLMRTSFPHAIWVFFLLLNIIFNIDHRKIVLESRGLGFEMIYSNMGVSFLRDFLIIKITFKDCTGFVNM